MFDVTKLTWTPTTLPCTITPDRIEMTTQPKTDLWQKTYGDFSEDNAPVLQMKTEDLYFTFTVKAVFSSQGLYDQCGIVMHLSENTWLKASMECEGDIKHLGSVATNHGYSDWAAVDVPADKTTMWYRMNRRNTDFLLEYSEDGENFSVLRMCHMWDVEKEITFGLYACSPRESSFTAVFTNMDYQVKTREEM